MKNVGTLDKDVRFTAFAVLVAAGIVAGGTTRVVLWIVALVPLLTAVLSFCPLWAVLHISTHKKS